MASVFANQRSVGARITSATGVLTTINPHFSQGEPYWHVFLIWIFNYAAVPHQITAKLGTWPERHRQLQHTSRVLCSPEICSIPLVTKNKARRWGFPRNKFTRFSFKCWTSFPRVVSRLNTNFTAADFCLVSAAGPIRDWESSIRQSTTT